MFQVHLGFGAVECAGIGRRGGKLGWRGQHRACRQFGQISARHDLNSTSAAADGKSDRIAIRMKPIAVYMEETGINVGQLVTASGLDTKLVKAIVSGNFTPSPFQ